MHTHVHTHSYTTLHTGEHRGEQEEERRIDCDRVGLKSRNSGGGGRETPSLRLARQQRETLCNRRKKRTEGRGKDGGAGRQTGYAIGGHRARERRENTLSYI